MVDYTASLIWLAVWPLVIFSGYKFAALNIRQIERLERLEAVTEDKTEKQDNGQP